jgi:dTDP-4-amino-4,6-dideoxygalactose transaminase
VRGKEVLIPTNTFFATALGVTQAGLRGSSTAILRCPVDMDSLRSQVTSRTAGGRVHIGGIVTPHMAEIQALCRNTTSSL